jgi:NADPH:quinone reductase-like Zn-dependent oxidoreductase
VDWKIRIGVGGGRGGMPAMNPGFDVAGVIDAVGPGATTWKVGDAVFGALQRSGGGGYAEYVLAAATDIARKPKNLTYEQAAGIPVAGTTALRAVNQINVQKGQHVLVIGAAGGVGSAALQLAKARGAYVIASASSQHNAFLKKIGADQVINYDKEKLVDKVKDVDAVINTVDSEAASAVDYVKHGGAVVLVDGQVDAAKCNAAGVTCGRVGPGALSLGEQLEELAKLAEAGKYTVKVEKAFPLEKAGVAQELNRAGHTEGKIILAITPQASKR